MKSFSKSLVAVSFFVSNFLFWNESGYFDTATELKPLLHTWSLAVEEQYYIIFPFFLMLAWHLGRRWILFLMFFAAIFSFSLAQWGFVAKPAAAFLFTVDARMGAVGWCIFCFLSFKIKFI